MSGPTCVCHGHLGQERLVHVHRWGLGNVVPEGLDLSDLLEDENVLVGVSIDDDSWGRKAGGSEFRQ